MAVDRATANSCIRWVNVRKNSSNELPFEDSMDSPHEAHHRVGNGDFPA